ARKYAHLAGQEAARQLSYEEAVWSFSQAYELTPEPNLEERLTYLLDREEFYDVRANRAAQQQDIDLMRQLADTLADPGWQAKVLLRQLNRQFLRAAYSGDSIALTANVQQALAYAEAADDIAQRIAGHRLMGFSYVSQGAYAEAYKQYQQCLSLSQQSDNPIDEARALLNSGICALFIGEHETSHSYFENVWRHYREVNLRYGEGLVLSFLSLNASQLGQEAQAEQYAQSGLVIGRDGGYQRVMGLAYVAWGEAMALQKNYEAATSYLQQGVTILQTLNELLFVSSGLWQLGRVAWQQQQYEAAQDHFTAMLTTLPIDAVAGHAGLARVALAQG
ncbi:MAG: hypothetical protein GY934_07835, partial [Gammaproteobacteria bacterium]|nr:hypothetical protein [Gammaproteobacteria bacterium]